MPRKPAPLPPRDGLGPARIRLLGGSVVEELARRFGPAAWLRVAAGEVVHADGTPVDETTVCSAGAVVYCYRDPPDEAAVPFDIDTAILHRDENLLVVDKPHFLATMPRGRHVAQTALVRLRRELDLPDLSPAHRLDRLTAGVLVFTVRPQVRGAYQMLFAAHAVHKTYLARSASEATPTTALPTVVRNRIIKTRGNLQAVVEPGEPNAETFVEKLGRDRYRLTPRTGRTHQLRVHMAGLGVPIAGDPLYPRIEEPAPAPENFTAPLALLAHSLVFDDPLTGQRRRFVSRRELPAQ